MPCRILPVAAGGRQHTDIFDKKGSHQDTSLENHAALQQVFFHDLVVFIKVFQLEVVFGSFGQRIHRNDANQFGADDLYAVAGSLEADGFIYTVDWGLV